MADNLLTPSGLISTTELPVSLAHAQHFKLRASNNDVITGTIANGLLVDVSRVNGTVNVTGPLSDAQLRATALVVEPIERVASTVVTSFPAGTASVTLVSALSTRRKLIVTNAANTTLLIKEGTAASLTSWSHRVAPNGQWVMDRPIYTGAVTAVWEAISGGGEPTGAAKITEA